MFAAGPAVPLKRFLVEKKAGGDRRLWRSAQALPGLCPARSDEKQWVDRALARMQGLGFQRTSRPRWWLLKGGI